MLFPTVRTALAATLLLLTSTPSTFAHPPSSHLQPRQNSSSSTACNNSPDLCDRQYNKITHMGAHGSSFLRDNANGISAAGNQFKNATDALDHGLRLLQAQAHPDNSTSTLHLCHTSCTLLDAGPLVDWLTSINSWMTSNPNEVVTILLVNYEEAPAASFGTAFEKSGLADIAYTPPTNSATSEWPTLQSMIKDNKRLVVFVTNTDATSDYPYLIPEFEFVFETAFEVTTLTGFNCSLDRPSGAGPAATALSNNYLSLINHFKYSTLGQDVFVPDVTNIEVVNNASKDADGNLGKHLGECKDEWGVVPNFVLVDFFDRGDVIKATDEMNEISNASGRSDASSDDDESKSSRTDRNMGKGALIAFVAAAVIFL